MREARLTDSLPLLYLTKSLNQQLEKRMYKREEAMNKKKKKQVRAG